MNTQRIAEAARNAVQAAGTTAHGAIGVVREGGERLGELAGQRWTRAFREASPRLTPETRRNATHARKVFGRYYTQGLQASTSGAEAAVDALVRVASAGIERASALAAARAGA